MFVLYTLVQCFDCHSIFDIGICDFIGRCHWVGMNYIIVSNSNDNKTCEIQKTFSFTGHNDLGFDSRANLEQRTMQNRPLLHRGY